ncbi:MAG TPA: DNA alkylation repair protein [Caulobacteraceae bacterium]|jgi:3-methyladenine DNA glycosylase AlkD
MTAPLDIAAEHAALVRQLRGASTRYFGGDQNDSYTGSGRPFYCVGVPERRAMIRAWLAAHKAAPDAELLAFADALFGGESHEEKTMGALLLGYSARARRGATPAMVDRWLGKLHGWAEIDSLCASVFSAADLLADWPAWRGLIQALSLDANINKRRAALVLLTTPVRTSDDPRFGDLAFEMAERLKGERDILITKAVSWLLRSMAARRGPEVAAYLDREAATLPAIAVRETRTKLTTGTKSGKSRKVAG